MPIPLALEPRDLAVLVLAPTGRDAVLAGEVLAREGIEVVVCRDVDGLCREIHAGAGAVLVTEEALAEPARERVAEALARQPRWSDLPVMILSSAGSTEEEGARMLAALGPLGNVTVLDRPVRVVSLVSAVHSALDARRRQYQVRELLARLERGVADRDRFLAVLGHELRNPLSAITFALDFLARAAGEGPIRRRLAVIERQMAQMRRLVDDLLDVSRLSTGKVTLSLAPVDLVALVAGCVESLREMATAQRVHLDLAPAAGPITVCGDPVRLAQITTNLVTNALKYTPAGGRVTVAVRASAASAEIVVEDTGVGLAPGMIERIFDPFVQVEEEIVRSRGGLGLGLALVRSLAELHGGAVRAESEGLGRGSRFTVHLPRAAGSLPKDGPAIGGPPGARRARSVVIIEDDADVREGLSELVASLGHHVTTAEDGPSGVAIVLETEPDAALVDLGLPGFDGFEVARAVRASLGTRVLLAAVSGYSAPEDRRRSREAGFDAHLVKPVSTEAVACFLEASPEPEPRDPG